MQIISFCCWHEVARTEQIKAWQIQKWGKWKGVLRGMLSFPILLLPSVWVGEVEKKTQGWPGKAWHLHLALHGYLHCAWLMQLNMDTLAGMCLCTKWHLCCVCSTCGSFLALSRKSWVAEKEASRASAFFILWSRKSRLAVRKSILFCRILCPAQWCQRFEGMGQYMWNRNTWSYNTEKV